MNNTDDILKNYRGKYSKYWIERWGLIPELPTSFDNANSVYELVAWLQRAFKNLLDDFQQLESEFEDFKNALIDLLKYLIPELIRRYHDSEEFRVIFITLLKDILAGEERNWVKDLLKELLEVDMREWIEDYLSELFDIGLKELGSRLDETDAQLTQNKLHSVSWLNALEYGFKNDGVSLNDDIMAHYIINDSDKKLYVPSGVYIFSRHINFPNECYLELDAKAEFKLVTENIQDYFITIRKGSTRSDYSIGSFIKGGELNANFCAKNGVGFYKNRHTIFESCVVRNVLEKGVVTRTDRIPDGQIKARDILIENDRGIAGTTGFFDNAFDTRAEGIEVVDFERAYYTVAGRFDNVNAWIRDSTILENSIFATIDGFDVTFDNVSVDTYRKGFKITAPEYSVSITNMLWITNTGVFTTQLQEKFNRTIFNADYPDRHFKVSGLKITNALNLSLSNIKLPKSSFLNVVTPRVNDPYNTIINFRNDNEKLHQLGNYIGSPRPLNLSNSTNFDLVVENGLYETDLYVGSGGKNAPTRDTGILEVTNIHANNNNLIVQKWYGLNRFGYRLFIANAWQSWVYFSKT